MKDQITLSVIKADFDGVRQQANQIADYMRRHGPFQPHRLPLEAMEYTAIPKIMEKLQDRFKKG